MLFLWSNFYILLSSNKNNLPFWVFVVYNKQHRPYGCYSIAYGVRLKGLGLSMIWIPKVTKNTSRFPLSYNLQQSRRTLFFRNPEKTIINQPYLRSYMAKNSFYIRASVNIGDTGAFNFEEIDIGSYTDLGSSKPEILRIHDVQVAVTNASALMPSMTGDTADSLAWQITTQQQSGLVLVDDTSFVSGGRAGLRNPDSNPHPPTQAWESQILAQDWMNGYLVAVPTLYLGGLGGANFTEDVYVSVILECTTEPATKATSISLAISQM
jgi:hypothetical protein